MYGTPLGLVILSIMRVIFSFTLVCITKQWHKYAYFIAYFISFAPFITTFPIFVLTAEVYKKEFNNFIARFIRKLKARWIL
jgi:predicted tellurium resistance membrane protein TerC